jgi:hypothetical protein
MDFLKKHYEKILLGLVLIGLAVAFVFLPFTIGSEKQKLEDLQRSLTHPRIKALTNIDLSFADSALKRISAEARLDFTTSNRLVNPMTWQQTRDTPPRLVPKDRSGPTAVIVTNIAPIYLIITLDDIKAADPADPGASARYVISVEKQAAAKIDQRKKKQYYTKIGEKNETFRLKEVGGPADNPTNIVLELLENSETVGINRDKPYRRVDGFVASLYYDPQKKKWTDQRIGQTLNINGEDYKIVAISKDEVVLSAPNSKKWPIKLSNSP